ncbi:hypothetical protein Chor_001506, partial [Crotalus horridus]
MPSSFTEGVRLLTGIGRYNEMTYIFDLLHEKHYFENGTLKTALLDYIKRCRPGDSEKHNMIALCFSMCREIGENHEAAANVQLKLIESQPWGKDSPAQGGPSGRRSGGMEAALGDPPR